MAERFLKTLKLPGIDEPYKIPQTAEDVGAPSLEEFYTQINNKMEALSSASGSTIVIDNTIQAPIYELRLYGKTTQSGIPSPSAPVPFDNYGKEAGKITVNMGNSLTDENPRNSTLNLPNGLPGVPVESGGNYIDENGQQWVCDELDFSKERYIQRVGIYTTNEATKWLTNGSNSSTNPKNFHVMFSMSSTNSAPAISKTILGCLCDQFAFSSRTGSAQETEINVFRNFTNQYYIAFDVDISIANSLAAWKEVVVQNPLTVYYVLETPIETKLTTDVIGSSYKPPETRETLTAIWNSVGAHMDLKYCSPLTGIQINELATLGRRAIYIPDDSDLNEFIEPGTYFCNATTAKTLINCPVTTGFKLYIGASTPTGGYYFQIIQNYQNDFYIRYTASEKSNEQLKWYDWHKILTTRTQIPTGVGGIGSDMTEDYDVTEHLYRVELFMQQVNKKARFLGLKNSVFKTPSGLNTEPRQGAANSTDYNSYTTPYDLIRLLIAVRNTPGVFSAMSTRTYPYFLNGTRNTRVNIMLGSSVWKEWEEETQYEILAGKGGSLGGAWGGLDNKNNGILNQAMLIKANGKVYAFGIMGFDSVSDWDSSKTYAEGKKVHYKVDGVTHCYVSTIDNNSSVPTDTDTEYWDEIPTEGSLIRGIMEEMISMIENSQTEPAPEGPIASIIKARPYVALGAVRLSDSGKYGDDIFYLDDDSAASSRFFYNGDTAHVAASTTKIITALTVAPYLTNHYCTVSHNDLVGGSGLDLKRGDVISSFDALNVMLGESDNQMATMLGRIYAKKVQETGLGELSHKNKYTSFKTIEELNNLQGNGFWAYNGGSNAPLLAGLNSSCYVYGIHYQYSPKIATQIGYCVYTGEIIKRYKDDGTGEWKPWEKLIDSIGAAPAGYGLGKTSYENLITSISALDALKVNCNFLYGSDADPIVISPYRFAYAYGRVDSYEGSRAKMTIIPVFPEYKSTIVRYAVGGSGTWGEWEWENPPMELGVEYCTTERHNGKSVYVKCVNYGYIAAGTTTIAHGISSIDDVVGLDIINRTYGYFSNSADVHGSADRTNISVTSAWAMGGFVYTIKYTKL